MCATRLTAKDLDFAVVDYDFTGFTASELGGLDNLELSIDALLAEAAADLAAQQTLSASMDGDLAELGAISGEMNAGLDEDTLGQIADAASTGDALLSSQQDTLSGTQFLPDQAARSGGTQQHPAPTPAPPATPTPPNRPGRGHETPL